MTNEPTELIEFLAPYPLEVQHQALRGREFLFEQLTPVTELHYDATSAVCAGFCYSGRPSDVFVNIAVYSDHITLVFAWGAGLDDPEGRLQGQGSRVRHIRLRSDQDLRDPYVLGLIRQAADAAPGSANPAEPTRVVKVYAGPKRRPR